MYDIFSSISCCSLLTGINSFGVYRSRRKLTKTSYSEISNPTAWFKLCIPIHMLIIWKLDLKTLFWHFIPIQEDYMNTYVETHHCRKYTGKDFLDYSATGIPPYGLYHHMDICIHQWWCMMLRIFFISNLIAGLHIYLLAFYPCLSPL